MKTVKSAKRILSVLLSFALLLTISISAMAAETQGVSVVVDGQTIDFSDASPCVKDGRTMLPLTAVVEAMGGTTQWDSETSTITATLNGTTITITVGSVDVTVTKDGSTTTLSMDTAPYVDSTSNRTYVPVRFAAEAFGCNIGWDQDSHTVVIVDTDKLVSQVLSNYQFTILENYMDYSKTLDASSLSVNETFAMELLMLGQTMASLDGTVSGVSVDGTAAQLTESFTLNLAGLMSLTGLTDEDLGSGFSDGSAGLSVEVRADLSNAMVYCLYSDAINEQLGIPAGAWISIDLNELFAESGLGISLADLLSHDYDLTSLLLTAAGNEISLDGKASTGYQEVSETLNSVAAALSDSAFTKTAAGYENTLSLAPFGADGSVALTLTTDSSGAVTGYTVSGTAAVSTDFISDSLSGDELTTLALFGGLPETIDITLDASQGADGISTCQMSALLGNIASLSIEINSTCTAATTTAETTPPAGATIVPFADLTGTTVEGD
ncbi:MAG: hypothetical protein H6Q60_723 [Oscillospiraceae bacterium]|nr:hypothetical protein [Oscillospiraceae bacterium]